MNILTLVRDFSQKDKKASLGRLFLDGKFLCDTLEDEFREIKIHSETRIPAGSFKIQLANSPKFSPRYGHEMLWITNVPNFEGILIHPGNTDKDTSGCILLGQRQLADSNDSTLINSRNTYDNVYKTLRPLVNGGLYISVLNSDVLGK